MIIQKPCTNFAIGRKGYRPELFVIHIIAGSQVSCDSWFANPISQVSSHFSIGSNGEVHQYVDTENTAWANGIVNLPNFKLYKSGVNPNLYTISIENEGTDLSKASETHLKAICELLRSLSTKYAIPLTRDTIIGHYQIDKKRKPNCPATDKSVIDKIVSMCQTEEMVNVTLPKSKLLKAQQFLSNL